MAIRLWTVPLAIALLLFVAVHLAWWLSLHLLQAWAWRGQRLVLSLDP
ncbi:hypothetical protein [Pseudoxanthomonas sp. J35]|nr:hypothetical protein [Pseudoxanthomonas sp. J35]